MLTIVAVLFFVFLFINVPVAFALALATIPAFLFTDYMPMTVAVQRMYGATQSFPLLAVPFFILAGNLMNTSGITERLLRFARLLTGWMAGGLGQVAIALSALMGGISGAAVADAAMEARILGPAMVAKGRGAVINLSSWLGKKGMKLYGGYAASKFAVIGMTQALALEVAAFGVRVNALCPGLIVETGMRDQAEALHRSLGLPSAEERVSTIPRGRLGKPDDIARVAAFLASDEADFMTGQAVNVTGGFWLN